MTNPYLSRRQSGVRVQTPSQILSGLAVVLDPASCLVTGGNVETFYGPTSVSQSDAAKRAAFSAADASFNGQPSATFDGVGDFYPLGDLSVLAAAEMFVVLQLTADPPAVTSKSGFHYIGGVAASTHYPYTDGVIYDGFGTTARKTAGDPALTLTSPHLYNVRSAAGDWTLELNGVQVFTTATNTAGFASAALFGTSFGSAQFLDGKVAYAALCNQVQTPTARARMNAYLAKRFGIAIT